MLSRQGFAHSTAIDSSPVSATIRQEVITEEGNLSDDETQRPGNIDADLPPCLCIDNNAPLLNVLWGTANVIDDVSPAEIGYIRMTQNKLVLSALGKKTKDAVKVPFVLTL